MGKFAHTGLTIVTGIIHASAGTATLATSPCLMACFLYVWHIVCADSGCGIGVRRHDPQAVCEVFLERLFCFAAGEREQNAAPSL